jgi:hypothetical protein
LNGVAATTLSGTIAEQTALVLNAISGGAAARPVIVISLQTAMRLLGTVRDLEAIGVTVIITPAATNRIIGVDAATGKREPMLSRGGRSSDAAHDTPAHTTAGFRPATD